MTIFGKITEIFTAIPLTVRVIALLCCSNLFMLFAWYGHLRNMQNKPFIMAVLVSWGIAFFEYMLMIPANRMGAGTFSVAQLKIMQEVITVTVFVPFMLLFMGEKWRLDYLWAFLCMVGAVYFVNRAKL